MKKITKISKILLIFMMIFSQFSSVVTVLADEITIEPIDVKLTPILGEDGTISNYTFNYKSAENSNYTADKSYKIDVNGTFTYVNGTTSIQSYTDCDKENITGQDIIDGGSCTLDPISKDYNGTFTLNVTVSEADNETIVYEKDFTNEISNMGVGIKPLLKKGAEDVSLDSETNTYKVTSPDTYKSQFSIMVGELAPDTNYRVIYGNEQPYKILQGSAIKNEVFDGGNITLTDSTLYGEYKYNNTITLEELSITNDVVKTYTYSYDWVIDYEGNNADTLNSLYSDDNIKFDGENAYIDAVNLNSATEVPTVESLKEKLSTKPGLELTVLDESGNPVSSGELKNGYTVVFKNGATVSYNVVVKGDNTSDNIFDRSDMIPTMKNYLNSESNLAMDLYTPEIPEEKGTITFEDIMYINELLKGTDGNKDKVESANQSLKLVFSEIPEEIYVGDTLTLSLLIDSAEVNEYIDGINGLVRTNELLKIDSINFNSELVSYNEQGKFVAAGNKLNQNKTVVMTVNLIAVAEGEGTFSIEGQTAKFLNISPFENTSSVKIIRKISGNSYLSSLKANVGTFDTPFDKDVTTYTLTVPYDTESVILYGSLEDAYSMVDGLIEYKLIGDKTTAVITVTAEDGSIRTYTVYIVREAKPVVVTKPVARVVSYNYSSNNYLKLLEISGYEIEFDSNILEYRIKVGNDVDSLDIKAIAEDSAARVEITGNENFKVGENIVTITVTAEDGSSREYKIIVDKEEAHSKSGVTEIEDSSNTAEKIVIIILIVLVVLGLLYLIFKKDNDDEDNSNMKKNIKDISKKPNINNKK